MQGAGFARTHLFGSRPVDGPAALCYPRQTAKGVPTMFATALAMLLLGQAQPAPAYEKYQAESETTCLGKADLAWEKPDKWTESGYTYTITGGRAQIHGATPAKDAHLGLLAAVKDFGPET